MVGGGARERSARRERVQARTSRASRPANIMIGWGRHALAHELFVRPGNSTRRSTAGACVCMKEFSRRLRAPSHSIRPVESDRFRALLAVPASLFLPRARGRARATSTDCEFPRASRRAPVRSRWADDALARLPPGEDREAYRAKQGGRSCRVRRVVSLLCHLGCSRPCSRTSRDE